MRRTRHASRQLLAAIATAAAVGGCGGGLVLSFGDNEWPLQLSVVAPTRIETGEDFSARPGGLADTTGLRFEWDFGDGSAIRFDARPTHRFDRAGSYTIALRVSDDDESLDASLRVEVGAWSVVDGRPCTGVAASGWCQLDAPGGAGAHIDALWFFDTREGMARDRSGALWRSGNGGRSWFYVGPSTQAAFAADGSAWDVRAQQLWLSTDRGRSWRAATAPAALALAAEFVDRDSGWLRGAACESCPPSLYRTHDGARSWQTLTLPPAASALHFVDRQRGVASDGRSAAWTTQDGGQSWSPAAVNFGSAAGRVQRIVFAAPAQAWMLVQDKGSTPWLLRSSDGGRSWTAPQAMPAGVADLAFGDDRHGWAVGEAGTIWATRDGGQSWQVQASGSAWPLSAVTALDGRTAWAGGAGGTLLATATGGR